MSVPLTDELIDRAILDGLPERFAVLHEERYGHRMDDPVEVVTARLRAIGRVPRPQLPLAEPGDIEAARIGARSVFRGHDTLDYTIYRRETLGRDDRIDGPAIVEEHTATTVVHIGDTLVVGQHGELIVSIAPEE